VAEFPEMRPRTKAPKGVQLAGELTGDLGRYQQVGLPQRAVGKKSAYRYRGCLLMYQQALGGQRPSVDLTKQFLGHLRKEGFSEDTIYVHRAVLQGFHRWRGERFDFAVRRPRKQPKYVEPKLVERILALRVIQELAGHESVETTQVYVGLGGGDAILI
jgi:hypothetical protein